MGSDRWGQGRRGGMGVCARPCHPPMADARAGGAGAAVIFWTDMLPPAGPSCGCAPAHCARKAPCYQPCGHCGGAANHPVQGETACAFTWAWVRQLRRRQAGKAVAAWTAMNKCAACALAASMKGGFDGECAATCLCHRLGYGSKKLCHCAGPGERLHMAPRTRSLTRSLGAVRREWEGCHGLPCSVAGMPFFSFLWLLF